MAHRKTKILKNTEEAGEIDTNRSPTSTILLCPLNLGAISSSRDHQHHLSTSRH